MRGISTEAKVGLLFLLALLVLAFLTFRAGNYEFESKEGFRLKVIFRSVAGLDQKARVKVRGVDSGYIEDISLMPDGAQLTLRIKEGSQIRKNAIARIQSLGLMGEKYIEIEPGSEKFPLLQDGDLISIGLNEREIGELTEQIGLLADDLITITHSIKKTIATQEGEAKIANILGNMETMTAGINNIVMQNQKEINRLVKNLADFSEELNRLVLQNKDHVGSIVTDLNSFSSDLARQGKKIVQDMGAITESLGMLMDPNTENIGSSLERLPHITQKLESTLDQLHAITTKMNKGEGTIGKLLTDDNVYQEISGTLNKLHTTLNKTESFKLHLGFKAEYLTEYGKSKSYFSLKFQPHDKKYYMIEFVDDFVKHVSSTRRLINQQGIVTSVEEESEEKLLISIFMAQKLGPFFLRGGLIESEGGAGIDYYTLGDNLCLGIEGWDFDLSKPHLKLFARLMLKRYFYVNMGWDDLANSDTQSFFAGIGFSFEDDDLKYLLTRLPLPGL